MRHISPRTFELIWSYFLDTLDAQNEQFIIEIWDPEWHNLNWKDDIFILIQVPVTQKFVIGSALPLDQGSAAQLALRNQTISHMKQNLTEQEL